MSIEVICPNGHVLKVKDKYAGKKGLCPLCKDQVVITVPPKLTEDDIAELIGSPARQVGQSDDSTADQGDKAEAESVFDDTGDDTSGVSLIGRSAVYHRRKCPKCGEDVPYWYARCSYCNTHLSGTYE